MLRQTRTFCLAVAVSVVVALCAASRATAAEPTGEEIMKKFVDATGGADAYAKVKTRVSTGTIKIPQQGMTGDMTLYQKAPNLVYVTGSMSGITFERGFDGNVAYEKNSIQGVRVIEGDEKQMMQQQSLSDPLKDFLKNYKDVKNLGVEQLGGKDAYKLELTLNSGDKMLQWYDKQTGLLTQTQMTLDSANGKLDIISTSSDWRDLDGVKVPFKSVQMIQPFGIEQDIEFTKIENNVEIPADRFQLPEDVKSMATSKPADDAPTTKPSGK